MHIQKNTIKILLLNISCCSRFPPTESRAAFSKLQYHIIIYIAQEFLSCYVSRCTPERSARPISFLIPRHYPFFSFAWLWHMVQQSWCLLKLSWQSFQKQTTSQSQPGSEESLFLTTHSKIEFSVLTEFDWLKDQRGEYCESEWMKRRFITEIVIEMVPQVSVRSSSHVKDQLTEKSSLFLFRFQWLCPLFGDQKGEGRGSILFFEPF